MIEEEFNMDPYWKDPDWAAFNTDSFAYGTGGADMYGTGDVYSYVHPEAGFLNLYSTSGVEEDKAEIFATLFVKSEYDSLTNFIQNDTILLKKKMYMTDFLNKKDSNFTKDYFIRMHSELD
jgi:hypothetical protein